jgi:hypothetical protein
LTVVVAVHLQRFFATLGIVVCAALAIGVYYVNGLFDKNEQSVTSTNGEGGSNLGQLDRNNLFYDGENVSQGTLAELRKGHGPLLAIRNAASFARTHISAILLSLLLVFLVAIFVMAVLYLAKPAPVIPKVEVPNEPVKKRTQKPQEEDLSWLWLIPLALLAGLVVWGVWKVATSTNNIENKSKEVLLDRSGKSSGAPRKSVGLEAIGSKEERKLFIDKAVESAQNSAVQDLKKIDAKQLSQVKDRFIGSMAGLALADARSSGVDKSGWTNRTSLSLCCLASMVEHRQFNHADLEAKWKQWERGNLFNPSKASVEDKKALLKDPFLPVSILTPMVITYIFLDTEPSLRVASSFAAYNTNSQDYLDIAAVLAYILRRFIKGTLTKANVCQKNFVEDNMGWYFDKYPYGTKMNSLLQVWPGGELKVEPESPSLIFHVALQKFCLSSSFEDGLKVESPYSAMLFGQLFGAYFGLKYTSGKTAGLLKMTAKGVPDDPSLVNIVKLTSVLWTRVSGEDIAAQERAEQDNLFETNTAGEKTVKSFSAVNEPKNDSADDS